MCETDVALVGAGPIGLEMAVALKRAGIAYRHFEKAQIGATVAGYPRQVHFFSSADRIAIAGVPIPLTEGSKATREEYLAYLRGIVTQFDLAVQTYETVVSITARGAGFALRTRRCGEDREHGHDAARVIVAMGDMHQPRRLHIPGEDLPHVSHHFDEPHAYFRRRLLVVGGGNSAVETALRCHHAGAQVALSYRGSGFAEDTIKYWLLPEIRGRLRRGEIEALLGTLPLAIEPGRVRLQRVADETAFAVEADHVLLMTGYEADHSLLARAGVALVGEERHPAFDADTMETNVPGLYVAGTATAGTQRGFHAYIETSHIHVQRILAALTGAAVPAAAPLRPDLES